MTLLRIVWRILTSRQRRDVLWALILIVLMAFVEIFGVLSIVPFLTVLAQPNAGAGNAVALELGRILRVENSRDLLTALGLLSVAAVLFSSIFKASTLGTINRMIHGARHSLSSRLLAKYLAQPYEFFLQRNAAILGKNVLSEVDQLQAYLIQPLAQVIAQGAVVFAMLSVMVWHDAAVALGLVAVVGSLYGAIYLFVRAKLVRLGRERQQTNTKRHQACTEALFGIKDVKVTASVGPYQKAFDAASAKYSHQLAASDTLSQTPLYLVEAVGYTGLIVVSLISVQRTGDLSATLPTLGLFGFATYRMLPACQVIYRGFAKLRFSSSTLERVVHDLELRDSPSSDDKTTFSLQREIRLSNLYFSYPSSQDRPVLQDINLVIPAFATSGIRGPSGAGKSTLMDLLLGLLHPQGGSIEIDGVSLEPHNVGSWQRSIGYVPQHIYLADTTIAENIAFGIPAKDIDVERLYLAARRAQIHDFIVSELPEGYGTRIGDRGMRLSGGQRQRIGIARALYRDPPILFFDEATSALDDDTLRAFSDVIEAMSGKKTIVVIAHQGIALRNCDFITDLSANPG